MKHIELTDEEKEYVKKRSELIFDAWEKLCLNHSMKSEFNDSFYLSLPITYEVVVRYVLDRRRIKDFHPKEINPLNEFKIAGYLSYWICKLRPVQHKETLQRFTKTQSLINEELAFHISISRINEERIHNGYKRLDLRKENSDIASFMNNLFYTLKYRHVTGDVLSLIYINFERIG